MSSLVLDSILVATDLTEGSDHLVRAAGAIAAVMGAELHVVHAFDVQTLPYARGGVGDTFSEWTREARRRMDAQLARALPTTSSVRIASHDVVVYAAHKAITDGAERASADLIVLGPHRARGSAGGFLGTTADRVIRTASAPCLIVPDDLALPTRRVVVPIDLSEPARAALDLGVEWTRVLGPEAADERDLRVLHVAPTDAEMGLDEAAIQAELEREAEKSIARTSAGDLDLRCQVVPGDAPAAVIVEYASREEADLVVMGTHGYGAVRRSLIGSIASGVAREAPCPVLLVPPALWRTPAARMED